MFYVGMYVTLLIGWRGYLNFVSPSRRKSKCYPIVKYVNTARIVEMLSVRETFLRQFSRWRNWGSRQGKMNHQTSHSYTHIYLHYFVTYKGETNYCSMRGVSCTFIKQIEWSLQLTGINRPHDAMSTRNSFGWLEPRS